MKIIEAIMEADLNAPNDIEQETKLRWLSRLDGQLADTVYGNHVGTEVAFRPYDEQTNQEETDLLVPAPYDGLYPDYLTMMIYLTQQEISRYNNAATVYAESLRRFRSWFNSQHMPKTVPALGF